MQHGQNQQWDNINLTLHNNLGNLLPSTESSTEITHSPCPSFINFFAPTSINISLNIFRLNTQLWTLKETGALRSMGQGQNSPSPLWKTLVKLILYYRAQWYNFSGTVPLTRYLILNIQLVTSKRTTKSTEILWIVLQKHSQWTVFLFFPFKCIRHMREHHH
jgi:hypothetical protein